ncbi:methionyl aminopeptidase [Simkania negevensis]|uniref:Methionine aminopeptidase n=1 Tax=Simkania negevensis TaxID=83561 RepID=A0ABS3ATS6_9BACT|nr:methionyl aminopeptidase [Simkania negevensis]
MLQRNDPCWCGSGKKWKKCHYPIHSSGSEKQRLREQYYKNYKIILKTSEEIAKIRSACRLAAKILNETCKVAKKGITTEELNAFAHQMHLNADAVPAPLHYGSPPFPKSICTSLNEVICHGIPDNTELKDDDILNIDVTCILDGFYGDCSKMVMVGNVSERKKALVDVSYQCLMESIAILKPGVLLCDIGEVIESYATQHGCSVVHQFVAHGVGTSFHEAPQIPHNRNQLAIPLVQGMTFTIEPMINAGVSDAIIDPFDKWTARTADGAPSAQWEHTLLITSNGCEILTALDTV